MKLNLIFPPQWTPFSPHCAPTVLNAEAKKAGIETKVIDLNIDFYEKLLSPQNLISNLQILSQQKAELAKYIRENIDLKNKDVEFTDEQKLKINKYTAIFEIEKIPEDKLYTLLESVPEAISVFRDQDRFYNLDDYQSALFTLDFALQLISLPFYPWEITLHDYMNPYFKFTWDGIMKESRYNIFSSHLQKCIPDILSNEPDVIGISVSSSSELIASLSLCKILKTKSDVKVFLGGNYISRLTDTLLKTPEFFEEFVDYVIYEEGEKAIVDFVQYIEGKIKIKDVSSLIYRDEIGKVKMNPKGELVKLNDTATQNLDDYNLNKYLLPEIVLPVQASRGCYWRKCTFCDHDFGQTYNVKSVEKVVDELEELQNKYGISYFEFTDEAISAPYLKSLSEAIIKRGLKINWYCDCRLESNLTYEIFKVAREAGLRMIMWGYESGSKRIMEMINKGVDIDRRLEILKAANDADIWNFAYIFFGFPDETIEDAMKTVNDICENIDIIPAYGRSVFTLGKHALMNTTPEKFGIVNLNHDAEPFSSNCAYKKTTGLQGDELNDFIQRFTQYSMEKYNYPAWMSIRYRETLLLYIVKYSMAEVKKMRSPLAG